MSLLVPRKERCPRCRHANIFSVHDPQHTNILNFGCYVCAFEWVATDTLLNHVPVTLPKPVNHWGRHAMKTWANMSYQSPEGEVRFRVERYVTEDENGVMLDAWVGEIEYARFRNANDWSDLGVLDCMQWRERLTSWLTSKRSAVEQALLEAARLQRISAKE